MFQDIFFFHKKRLFLTVTTLTISLVIMKATSMLSTLSAERLTTYEVLQILGISLIDKASLKELPERLITTMSKNGSTLFFL